MSRMRYATRDEGRKLPERPHGNLCGAWRVLIEAMADSGSHFWDRATMRFFDSRRAGVPIRGADGLWYFATSERFRGCVTSRGRIPDGPRKWTVRVWTGETVNDIGGFQAFDSQHDAMRVIRAVAKLPEGRNDWRVPRIIETAGRA